MYLCINTTHNVVAAGNSCKVNNKLFKSGKVVEIINSFIALSV